MAINLSNVTFTDQDDIVPPLGVEPIISSGRINTLAGNDIINGGNPFIFGDNDSPANYAFLNEGTLNTNSGNDLITGIYDSYSYNNFGAGIENRGSINTGDGNDTLSGINGINGNDSHGGGIENSIGIIDTGDGNDMITGVGFDFGIFGYFIISDEATQTPLINTGNGDDIITASGSTGIGTERIIINTGNGDDIITAIGKSTGIDSRLNTTINTGDGNDIITAIGDNSWGILLLNGTIDTGEGNDIINGTGGSSGLVFSIADFTSGESQIDTGEGDDTITGTGSDAGISNNGTVNTGNGKDSVISHGRFDNSRMFLGDGDDSIISYGVFSNGEIFLGNGDDSIIVNIDFPGHAIVNSQMIDTGDGNDTITSTGVIYNEGVINTGDGADSIIVDGAIDDITGTTYGIYNNGGAIIMGNGNDSIIANQGFKSGENSSGAWFLGEGEDYIKGFGSGDFYGGNGNDTLELTPGTYTVGIWGEGGESPIFTKGNQLMITSEFEKLKAGGTTYDFANLTAGQIIVVA
jgi:hypothetical protein